MQIEFDGGGIGSRRNGRITQKCDCIEWEDDSAWARPNSLTCGAATAIAKVHLVFMNHLDIGYNMAGQGLGTDNGFISAVLNRYTQVYFPLALNLSASMRLRDPSATGDRFIYTTHPWLLSLFLDCPAHLALAYGSAIACPSQAQKDAVIDAISRGEMTWHHAPFNLQNENVGDPILFDLGLELADDLDRRFGTHVAARNSDSGKSAPRRHKVFNLRDVPGSTRAVLPLLQKRNFSAITIGQNPGTPTTLGWGLHKMFRWRDEASGAELLGLNHGGGYPLDPGPSADKCGGLCREDCMMAPGLPEALCFAFRTDNSGPPANDEAVAAVFAIVREQFPKAKVLASTLGDFVAAVQPYMSSLDLVTSEVGDTWIQGVQSDPLKMATYREIARGLVSCIELGACDRHDKTVLNASRFLLKAPEHTWGLPGANDSTHWNNSDFGAAYEHDSAVPPQSPQRFNYRDLNEGWQEHRLFNDFALSALRPHASDVHDTIAARLAQLRPRARDAPSHASLTKAGYAPVTNSERARGLFSAAPSAPRISCGDASFTISEHGALSSLRLGGSEWAAETSPIGLLQYATYAEDDFDEMNAVYKGPFGARCGYGKPRMRDFAPDAKREDFVPTIGQIYLRHSNANTSASANAKSHAPFASSSTAAGGCSVVAELRFASRAVRAYGAPQSVWLNISVVDGRSNLDVRLTMFNKTRTRLPEAMHWSFYPQTPQPFSDSAGEAIADTEADAVKNNYPVKYNYTMDKLGSRISPFETCVNGNPRQHAVWKGVYFGPETVKSPTQPHGTAFARQGRADETGLPILPILPSRSTVQPFSAAMELAEVPQVSKVPKAAEARGSSSPGAPRASAGPTLRFSSLDAAVAAVADAEQPPTPFLKDLNPLSRPLTGVGYNLWNNIWNTNYPLYYPFEPSGDENLLFRFEIALEP